jgi:subtilisin family serine protease
MTHHSLPRTASLIGLVLRIVCALGLVACRRDAPDAAAPSIDRDFDRAKVDPAITSAFASRDSVSVIVLGQNQLLDPVGGLERFERERAGWTRQALRIDVVTRLRALAAAEQTDILATIGSATRVRQLWIYNAVAGTLSRSQVAALSQLPSVAYVYANTGERVVFPTGQERVSLVVGVGPAPSSEPDRVPPAWHIRWLGADRVWSELRELGAGAVIASIDDGVNYAHADVRSHVWKNTGEIVNNARDDDANGYVDDVHGYDFAAMSPEVRSTSTAAQHGTWTAGLMVADGTSGIVSGVAPRAKLMVLRAGGHVAIAEAVQYAVAMGADVVNMSFTYRGEGNRRALWRMMSDHAVAAGLVLAGGAGNNQLTDAVPYQIGSPKDAPSMFVAGGIDTTFQVRPFSSLGPVEWGTVKFYGDYPLPTGLVKPDVVAFPGPGLTVLALADNGYLPPSALVQGNSFSGPQAAGVAALVMSAVPTMAGWRAREVIESTARDIAPNGKDARTGCGLIDALAAVRAARALAH